MSKIDEADIVDSFMKMSSEHQQRLLGVWKSRADQLRTQGAEFRVSAKFASAEHVEKQAKYIDDTLEKLEKLNSDA